MSCIEFLPRPAPQQRTETDEASIVADLKAGSEESYAWLVREFRPFIFRLVRRIVDGRADVSDATQEIFLKIFRGIQHFHGGSSLKTWIHRIAVREAFNQVRWWSRHKARETSFESANDTETREYFAFAPVDRMPEVRASPFDDMMLAELRAAVRFELSRLPEPYRTAVVLRDIEGWSYREIARMTGAPVGSVSSRLAHGRNVLKSRLDEIQQGTSLRDL